jgi:hypothetical protein
MDLNQRGSAARAGPKGQRSGWATQPERFRDLRPPSARLRTQGRRHHDYINLSSHKGARVHALVEGASVPLHLTLYNPGAIVIENAPTKS